jgi:hypothetical protein
MLLPYLLALVLVEVFEDFGHAPQIGHLVLKYQVVCLFQNVELAKWSQKLLELIGQPLGIGPGFQSNYNGYYFPFAVLVQLSKPNWEGELARFDFLFGPYQNKTMLPTHQ